MSIEDAEAWRALVHSHAERLAEVGRSGGDDGLRVATYLTWRLLDDAPSPIRELYADVAESQVSARADAVADALASDAFGFVSAPSSRDVDLVAHLAGHLRALENAFHSGDDGGRPADPNVGWRIEHGGAAAFFVPLARSAWRSTREPEKDRRPFGRRGLLRVRIIPVVADGVRVRLAYAHGASGTSRGGGCGAVQFPGLVLTCEETDHDLRVASIDCAAHGEVLDLATEQMHRRRCWISVAPEYTIQPRHLDQVCDRLALKPWLDQPGDPGTTPEAFVAGTWQMEEEGVVRNVATVLDGNGNLLFRQGKRRVFRDNEGRRERITPAEEITILVLRTGLAVVAICKDFCDRGSDPCYEKLDVDFVLVPSFGNVTTMEGHLATAKDLHVRRGTRAFVVQHAYPANEGLLGWVLPPLGVTEKLAVADIAATEVFSVHDTD